MSIYYAECCPQVFRERLAAAPIAYLPLGTLEWHGEHLPLGADGIQSQGFFARLAERVGGLVLPMLFLGPDRSEAVDGRELHGMDVNGTRGWTVAPYPPQQLAGSAYWIDDERFDGLLDACMAQLARAGFRIVVAHGHGPSSVRFAQLADSFRERYSLRCCNCFGSEHDAAGLGLQCDHAGRNETSLCMALRPELVRMDLLPADPEDKPIGVGPDDPREQASADWGERAIALQLERMAGILADWLAACR